MCIGGGGPKVPKPAPLPPTLPPPPPPREAPAPRKPVEDPNNQPDLVLGKKTKKNSGKNRQSILSRPGVQGAPNTGSKSGTLNL